MGPASVATSPMVGGTYCGVRVPPQTTPVSPDRTLPTRSAADRFIRRSYSLG